MLTSVCLVALGLLGFSLLVDCLNRQSRDRKRRREQWKYRITVDDDEENA